VGKPEELLSGRSSSWFGAAPEQHLAGVLLLWQAAVQQGEKGEEGSRRRLVKQDRLWRCRSGHRPVLVAGEAGALLPLSLS